MYMFKIINFGKYETLHDKLDILHPEHGHLTRSRDNEQLLVPFPRVDAIKINFQYQFISIWNSIPINLKTLPTVNSFKKALTQHYVNMY